MCTRPSGERWNPGPYRGWPSIDRAWTPAFAGVPAVGWLMTLIGVLLSCAEPASDRDTGEASAPNDAIVDASADVPRGPLGQPFPVSTLVACDGSALDLTTPPAAATWLILTAGNCPSCKDQLPFVATFTTAWEPRGVRVVVALGDDGQGSGHVSEAYCQAFRSDFGLPGPVARDDGFASLGGFAGSSTPVQIVLDGDLTVRALAAGWDEDFHPGWIEREVARLLPEP